MDHPTPKPDDRTGPRHAVDRGAARRARRAARRASRAGRRKWPRRLLISALVLAVLAGGLVATTYFYARYRYDQIKKVHVLPQLVKQPAPGQPFNILLVGSDSRKFVDTTNQAREFGTPSIQGGQRSDVTIVARFIPATKQVWVISIPRDLWLHIPGDVPTISGTNRINAAFDGGPSLLIETIEKDLGIPINHYMEVTFQGFQNMVNALGGITMDFPDPVKDDYSGLDVTQTGCQTVNGATSLELVRARHLYYEVTGEWKYDGLSDFSRIQRQDAFFRALLQKLDSVKFDPFTVNAFLEAAVHDLTIDTTLSEGDLVSLTDEFHGLPQANLHTETLPTYGFTTTGGADVLGEAEPQAAQTIAAFNLTGEGSTAAPASSSTTTTTKPAVMPSQVDVQVLNGVDFTQPIASTTAAALKRQGFAVSGIANASTDTVTTTEVDYATGHEAAAEAVASRLSGATVLTGDPSLTGDHVIVTVGRSFSGVKRAAGTSSGSPTGATTGTGGASTGAASTGSASTGSAATGTPGTPTGTGSATTTTTTPPAEVQANTQQEPWNPTPCTLG